MHKASTDSCKHLGVLVKTLTWNREAGISFQQRKMEDKNRTRQAKHPESGKEFVAREMRFKQQARQTGKTWCGSQVEWGMDVLEMFWTRMLRMVWMHGQN